MTTLAERMSSIEATMYGRDGRGGMIGEVDQINEKVDRLIHSAIALAGAFLTATATLLAAIFTHTL